MIEKNLFKINDKKFTVFIPLVNLLLFDSLDSPEFDSESEKLSENFIKFLKTKKNDNLEENEFFKTRILGFLSDLEFFSRDIIFKIILENNVYFQSIIFSYIIDNALTFNKETYQKAEIKLLEEFGYFKFEGKLGKEIYYYFVFHFEGILFFEFANNSHVLKSEYVEIIQNICREKDFINLDFF